jgi:hypothetical protein
LRQSASVSELKHHHPRLRELNLWFRNNFEALNIRSCIFFETHSTHGVRVVDEGSSDPGIAHISPIPIDADHVSITKPTAYDSIVVGQTLITIDAAIPSSQFKFNPDIEFSERLILEPSHSLWRVARFSLITAFIAIFAWFAASLFVPPTPSIGGKEETACLDLKVLAAQSKNNFSQIRQDKVGENSWRTTAKLFGFSKCQIMELAWPTFTCDGPRAQDTQAATNILREKAQSAETCLGPDWTRSEVSDHEIAFRETPGSARVIYSFDALAATAIPNHFYTAVQIFSPVSTTASTTKSPDLPSGYCGDLVRVVSAAEQSFDPILRKTPNVVVGTTDFMNTTLQLGGWSDCTVVQLEGKTGSRYFSCTLAPLSEPTVDAAIDRIGSDIAGCLGSSWKTRSSGKKNGHSFLKLSSSVDADVELRSSRRVDGYWRVVLDVNVNR